MNGSTIYYRNPQSTAFCDRLGIRNLNDLFSEAASSHLGVPYFYNTTIGRKLIAAGSSEAIPSADGDSSGNPDEIDIGGGDDVMYFT